MTDLQVHELVFVKDSLTYLRDISWHYHLM
jgi:hypothetical protein